MSLKDYAMRKRKQWEEEMTNQVVSLGSMTSVLEPAVSVGGGAAESASPRMNGMEMEDVESREIASEYGEADAMAVDKDMRPHMPNGTDSLKAKFELVDDPMMSTDTEKALGVKDSQPPSPLHATAEKRVTNPSSTLCAVKAEQNKSARRLRKLLLRKKNNREKRERKAYAPDGLNIEGRHFECPFCHRMFERWGILYHLRGKHTNKILPSIDQDANLRTPKTPDHEFMEKLKSYFI
ncbi:hypothetical protein PILCRDRAFT_92611 [Piloderma croceum F 1598]|uniref:Uncharacterized protein n=1 Tax=Piloderma croceum (strain F 1598) TaxID=765440 RepID=A0A0C3EPE7_PILCF|nr:hypothetical protein PILCRDRAFT_92611 [Piloderma croceum F 1598]